MSIKRDPVRSLYMGICEDGIAISSELKSLQSLAHNVMPFSPGCYWRSKAENIYPVNYYTYEYPLMELPYEDDGGWSEENEKYLCSKINELFTKSVEKRLMSERPVGCLLSGGLKRFSYSYSC